MSNHTKGRIQAGTHGIQFGNGKAYNLSSVSRPSDPPPIADIERLKECWNLCDKIEDVGLVSDMITAISRLYADIPAECTEARKTIEWIHTKMIIAKSLSSNY